MTEDYELKDDVHRQQYEFRIGNYTPKIEYIKSINGEIYLTHTEVPRELEGKGIGSQLVEKTLQDIERQGLRLVPLCPFVTAYIKKHPEWRRIVMKGRINHYLATRLMPTRRGMRENVTQGVQS